ncbi:hypothetical protein DOY81_012240 [Sarcophaga bullata]|nr:hypothetical protein DOY81_012240 [Sarcophaga bullata]
MPKVLITEEMFKNMPCDAQTTKQTNAATGETFKPSVQIVFANSDIECSLVSYLVNHVEFPLPNAVATFWCRNLSKKISYKNCNSNGNLK